MPFNLPKLPYAYDALEPSIDAKTMEIHHGKHHQAYVDKANAALEGTEWLSRPIEDVMARLMEVPEDRRQAVRNHGGGVLNHAIFWTVMGPKAGGEPQGDLGKAIQSAFGDFASFQEQFTQAALSQFGSGWAWLVAGDSRLEITQTANQDSPVTQGLTPLLCIDVWEHAYYLRYQNRRPEYVKAWWNVVNWQEVAQRFAKVKTA
ncbi:superoxide dismutase [Candidatus Peregrinibacteria bacterium CG10_big_fil_rev_8_21_14_0_10_55_24]|nr:MAG: superoxide dismutase [Candidatus Peregrinibacteria bacterium CG10_big_fil_rev_8_21_14_0_10_55_24]